mgnify:CR=1 FL=1
MNTNTKLAGGGNTASDTALQTSSPPAVGIRARSASRGRTMLPIVMPAPNTASTSGIHAAVMPVTCSSVEVR